VKAGIHFSAVSIGGTVDSGLRRDDDFWLVGRMSRQVKNSCGGCVSGEVSGVDVSQPLPDETCDGVVLT
jgi:hypothetical protein